MKASSTGTRRVDWQDGDRPVAANEPGHGDVEQDAGTETATGDGGPRRHIAGSWRYMGRSTPRASSSGRAENLFHGLRILLVDDSVDTLEAFRVLLELEGAAVEVADNGVGALALATSRDFDLILSDIGMPGMDGYELIGRLRGHPRSASVPAFALSGFSDQAGVAHALSCGFDAYIDKPVTLNALRAALRALSGSH